MTKKIESGFTVDKAKPRLTLEFTEEELEQMARREKRERSVKAVRLHSSTRRAPIDLPCSVEEMAESLKALAREKGISEEGIIGRLEVHLDRGIIRALKARAAAEGRTVSEIIRGLILAAAGKK